MTTYVKMMNDILEEPEKDTLLETQPETQVLSVMPSEANPRLIASL